MPCSRMKTGGAKGNMVLVRGGPCISNNDIGISSRAAYVALWSDPIFSVADLDLCFIVGWHE